ncbi:MAG: Uma2 family endonuclease [Planctomycetes bacterium]|nr:Uma2 family endonuclease [Planctomycetota bacterium]
MSTTTQPLTADDLRNMPRDDMRHELVRGELRDMVPAGFDHGAIGSNLLAMLWQHVKAENLGIVVGPDTGFFIARDPDTVRCPDVGFVQRDRVPSPRPVKFWDGAPDLAVEVISPSDTALAVDEKVQDWLDAGTQEVIVINPKQKSVKVFRSGPAASVLQEGDVLEALESVPGFRCEIAELFV